MGISEHKQAYLHTHLDIQLMLWRLQRKLEQEIAQRCVWAYAHPKHKMHINTKFSIFITGTDF